MVVAVTLGDIIFYVFVIMIILCGLGLVLVNKVWEIIQKSRKKKREKELNTSHLIYKGEDPIKHYENAVGADSIQQSIKNKK